MNHIHPDLYRVLEAVEILSPVRYMIRGESRDVPAHSDRDADPVISLLADLETNIYSRLYLRPRLELVNYHQGELARRDFLASLSAANSGKGSIEAGCKVHHRGQSDGELSIVGNRDLRFWVSTIDVDFREFPAETCAVRVPKELRYLVPGFYYILGDYTDDERDLKSPSKRAIQLRYYWHLTSTGAESFVASATSILNEARIPFELKVLRDPDAYSRADAGVLYVLRRYLDQVAEGVARIHDRVARHLRSDVPLFTKKLADGLAFAEDPAISVSFGRHRCHLVAQGLWQSFVQGEVDLRDRAETLAGLFRSEGLDPFHPYIGVGCSMDDVATAIHPFQGRPPVVLSPLVTNRPSPLEAATKIGEALCRSAHWDRSGRFCNWIGRSFSESNPVHRSEPVTMALGADLYNGSTGIALFLAQLYQLTGDTECRRTAVAAISRSIRQSVHRPTKSSLSLSYYSGLLGIVIVAERVGAMVGDDELAGQSELLLDQLPALALVPHPLDHLFGNAGAIPALLALGRRTGRTRARDLAIALGDELRDRAIREGDFWTWDPEDASGPGIAWRPLTGMSHGAAGIALALLELHADTGRPEYLEAASAAFAYEDSVFDAEQGNWPDFRDGADPGKTPWPPRFAQAWCHGAPGIALARIRAASIDLKQPDRHIRIARTAVSTTLRAIDSRLDSTAYDCSLCHGLAGLLEVALVASRVFDDAAYLERVHLIATRLIERSTPGLEDEPIRENAISDPSLMLGLAGVGYSMLRMHTSGRVPSVLLVD